MTFQQYRDEFAEWLVEAEFLLDEFRSIDFAYPVGENHVLPPNMSCVARDELQRAGIRNLDAISAFYEMCDGLSWPGVQNSYFIHELDRLERPFDPASPRKLKGPPERNIHVVGANGGGLLFAIDDDRGCVLLLPHARVEDLTYYGEVAVEIAPDFLGFAKALLADLRAFVKDDREHRFIDSQP